MKQVILGMPGPWADKNHEAADHYTTKIGGVPDWPFPKSSVEPDILLCSGCGRSLCLLAQVYAPISSTELTIEERVIYVYCCMGRRCESSYRAVRVQKVDMPKKDANTANIDAVHPLIQSASSLTVPNIHAPHDLVSPSGFEEDDNSLAEETLDLKELQRAFSLAVSPASSSTKKSTKKKSKPRSKLQPLRFAKVNDDTRVLPCFYVYDEVEKSSKDLLSVCSSYSSLSIKERQDEHDICPQGEAWEEEGYEYDRSLSADRTYLKFKKRVDANPMQCFRYSYGGKPLLATGNLGDLGTCSLCGGSRHYEMQLMPPLLYYLQEAAVDGQKELLSDWNWMTILVYTCSKSCSSKIDKKWIEPEGWLVTEEAVIVQSEVLQKCEPVHPPKVGTQLASSSQQDALQPVGDGSHASVC